MNTYQQWGGNEIFLGEDLFNKKFWNYKFLAEYISTIQKFRGVTSLRFSPVPPSLHIKSKLVCMCIWYITFTSNNYVVLCISTFISYFLFLLYLISTDLTSIYCRSRTTTLQTPINVLYWKRFSNSFYKRRMYLIHYIIYLIPISIRRFEDYRNN